MTENKLSPAVASHRAAATRLSLLREALAYADAPATRAAVVEAEAECRRLADSYAAECAARAAGPRRITPGRLS